MCSVDLPWTKIYEIVKDWQTVWVLFPSLAFAWFTWETSTLVEAMDRKGVVLELQKPFPKEFFARRLSHLPVWLGKRVMRGAILRYTGEVTWTKWENEFIAEAKIFQKSRSTLAKKNWVK